MAHFDKTWFGAVAIDGHTYKDVLVIAGEVIDRGKWGLFDTHTVSEKELNELLKGNPEAIIIGNGQSGVLEVPAAIDEKIRKKGIELIVAETPEAIEEYNKLSKTKRVNALIHTTC